MPLVIDPSPTFSIENSKVLGYPPLLFFYPKFMINYELARKFQVMQVEQKNLAG